ncbi:MAG TPA: hypothetical protein VHF67_00010 [Gaiellaceae bacterium]|jgi:hypothetical protein|nr:hypothetical protein [Gaiellaceae bacterium]
MSEASVSPAWQRPNTAALAALIAGVAGVVVFLLAPVLSDALWPIGAAAALIAIVAGVIALRGMRGERGAKRWQAIGGLVLGALILAWFVIYLLLAAAGVVD